MLGEMLRTLLMLVAGWGVVTILLTLIGDAFSKWAMGMFEHRKQTQNWHFGRGERLLFHVYNGVLFVTLLDFFVIPGVIVLAVFLLSLATMARNFNAMGIPGAEWIGMIVLLAVLVFFLRRTFKGAALWIFDLEMLDLRIPDDIAQDILSVLNAHVDELGAKPISSVYIQEDEELTTFSESSLLQQLFDVDRIALLLGMGMLSGITEADLRVMAASQLALAVNHENLGGSRTLRIREIMRKVAASKLKSNDEYIGWDNLAVMIFSIRYVNMAWGGARLQQALSDRRTAQIVGSAAFINAIENVVDQTIRFIRASEALLKRVKKGEFPPKNIYQGIRNAKQDEAARAEFTEETVFDQGIQPSLDERIAFIKSINAPGEPPEHSRPAEKLIPQIRELQREYTGIIYEGMLLYQDDLESEDVEEDLDF